LEKNSKLSKKLLFKKIGILITKLGFFLILPFLVPSIVLGQGLENEKKYLWFDSLIGQTSSGVYKGVNYTNEYRAINEKHQFFKSGDFKTGSVNYKGQDYFELLLRYDVYLGNLLVVNDALANRPIMVFDKEGITRFTIDGHSFEYLSPKRSAEVEAGFFEVLLKNETLTLYKKHTKKIFKRTDAQSLYYEFKDGYSYVLHSDNDFYPFKKVKEVISIFPDYKKELRSIQKKHSALKKSDTDAYVLAVLTDLLSFDTTPKQDAL
jgi:hypothetical protein